MTILLPRTTLKRVDERGIDLVPMGGATAVARRFLRLVTTGGFRGVRHLR